MAKKNLYEVLETVPNASPETIEAQYRALLERLAGRTYRGNATDLERMALEEAHRTLSNAEQRKRYDARISHPVAIHPSMEADAQPWLARNRRMLLLFGLFAVCGFGYHRHAQEERAAEARALQEQQAVAARRHQAVLAEQARVNAEAEQVPTKTE